MLDTLRTWQPGRPGWLLLLGMLGAAQFLAAPLYAQNDLSSLFPDSATGPRHERVIGTFKSEILINGQSNKTMHRHDMLVIISHRFGDIGGAYGGAKTFFGMDAISDVEIGFDYGITNRLTAGVGRDKGFYILNDENQTELYYLTLKYRLLEQTMDNHIPLALTLFGRGILSTVKSNGVPTSNADFTAFSQRLSAVGQLILARKFSESFSLALEPTLIRRNLAPYNDPNNMLALGIGGRIKLNQHMAVVADYFIPFRPASTTSFYAQQYGIHFHNALGVGLEIETGGHVFHIDFTNATSIMENQFIPSTTSSWTNGGFRWGFNLTRTFTLGGKRGSWKK